MNQKDGKGVYPCASSQHHIGTSLISRSIMAKLLSLVQMHCGNLSRLYLSICVLLCFGGAIGQFSNHDSSAYDCDKYCFASCNQYSNSEGSEHSDCVEANVHCNCIRKFSWRNPFSIVLFVITILLSTCCLCCLCCWLRPNRSRSRFRTQFIGPTSNVVAQPVVATPFQQIAKPHITESTSADPFKYHVQSQPFFVQGQAENLSNLPDEYYPPPPYNECRSVRPPRF